MVKKNLPSFLASLLLILTGCSVNEIPPVESAPAAQNSIEPLSGEAVLLLTETAADGFERTADTASLDALGVRRIERVFPDAGEFEARHRAAGLHRWYRVSYDPTVSRTKAGDDLGALPGVESVSFPLPKKRLSFNDPNLYHQWNYINFAQKKGFKAGADINVEPVWEQYTGGSRDVIVAVIDGGVDRTHKDLAGVVLSPEEGSHNFVYGYSGTQMFADDHGTHVAGTIAAINNNGLGVCGVAGGLDGSGGVRIMTLPMFGPDEYDDGDDASAIVWAADHGAVIVNCSWGYICRSERQAQQAFEQFNSTKSALRSAIDYFIDNAGKDASGKQTGPMDGGVIFFASGNDGFKYGTPAGYEPVVAVGAFGPDGKMPKFSNYGEWVDLLAPGGSDSDYHPEEWVLSTVPTSNYAYMPGTSMACPHAVGVAALLVSYFGGPGFTNDMLKSAILNGSDPDAIDRQGRPAGGKLDALGAFEYMLGESNDDPDKISFLCDYTGEWGFKAHEQNALRIRIVGNTRLQLPVKIESDCPGISGTASVTTVDLTLDALKAEPGDYTVTIRVGEKVQTYPFTILPNHAPALARDLGDVVFDAKSAETFELVLDDYIQDPDGEIPQFLVGVSGDPVATANLTEDRKLSVSTGGYGLATVTILASDARKDTGLITFQILGRDEERELDIYPNPVKSWLHVRPGEEKSIEVSLYNRLGACVFETRADNAGPFQPLDIDMRDLPGGTYSLHVDGETYTIVKK